VSKPHNENSAAKEAVTPYLARITLYPVKSLDGQDVEEAVVLRGAGLRHDREYCLMDNDGRIVNTKRLGAPLVRIRSSVHLGFGEILLNGGSSPVTYNLERDRDRLDAWFSQALGQPVRLAQDCDRGFPDDLNAPGPTVISTATLEEVGSWFGLDLDEARRRFRANLEIAGVPAFWEDRLYGPAGETVRFRIGDVLFEGSNSSARCAVPSMDSHNGEIAQTDFAKAFAERRQRTLPAWAPQGRFDHFYRLAVNTRIPEGEAGKELLTGDELEL
jgi:uncharacterized protein YcbX